jgi:hypothetical protein
MAEPVPKTIHAVAKASASIHEGAMMVAENGETLQQLLSDEPLPLICGFQISADAVGAAMYAIASYGQIEGTMRLNLKGKYFPTLEMGLGHSNHTNDETELHYKTDAPYFRLGLDYNFARDVRSGNRIYGGLRAAYSNFKYDLSGPAMTDPYWGNTVPYDFKDLKASCTWGELVFGLEAKIWGNFHLGWSARYRLRLKQKENTVGQAWYIPGYGINDGHCLGATFNIIYDIQWNKPRKKSTKADL